MSCGDRVSRDSFTSSSCNGSSEAVTRNLLGTGVPSVPFLPFLTLPSFPFPSLSPPRVAPQIQLRDLGERRWHPQQGSERHLQPPDTSPGL